LKNDSIIDSNVIEGILSLPSVETMVTAYQVAYHAESKVMACHAMRGTHSSGDNIREGDTILEVAIDDDKDFSAECRMWATSLIATLLKEYCLFPLLSSWSRLTTTSPRSRLATPCVGLAAPGMTSGRETTRYFK
jgi:hypothetical protein